MPGEDVQSVISKGLEALSSHREELACTYFEQAIAMERTPQACSYLAYCLAKVRGRYQEAISLAHEALDREPENPLHYLNLGRVLSLSGDREQAVHVFRKGMEYGMHFEFIAELELGGMRKPSILKKLLRSNFLNKHLGHMLSRLKLR